MLTYWADRCDRWLYRNDGVEYQCRLKDTLKVYSHQYGKTTTDEFTYPEFLESDLPEELKKAIMEVWKP